MPGLSAVLFGQVTSNSRGFIADGVLKRQQSVTLFGSYIDDCVIRSFLVKRIGFDDRICRGLRCSDGRRRARIGWNIHASHVLVDLSQ